MLRLLAPALCALCGLSSASAATGPSPDAAALVQSAVRVHQDESEGERPAPDPKRAAGGAGRDRAAAPKRATAPRQPPAKHAILSPAPKAAAGRAAAGAGGSSLQTSLLPKGTGDDIDGTLSVRLLRRGEVCEEDCVLTWNDMVSVSITAEVPDGLQPGDSVGFHLVITPAPLDEANALAGLLPTDPVTFDAVCELCQGSCQLEMVSAAAGTMRATTPTHAISNDFCNDDGGLKAGLETVQLMREVSVTLPSGLGRTFEEIEGRLDWETSLLRGSGLRRAVARRRSRLTRRGGRLWPASLAQVSAEGLEELSGAVRGLRGLGGPMALTEASLRVLSEAAAAAAAELPRGAAELSLLGSRGQVADGPADRGLSGVVFATSLRVNEIERGGAANYSWAAEGCRALDEKGSYTCATPLGGSLDGALKIHLEANIERGATARVKVEPPRVEGLMGLMVKSMWKKLGNMDFSYPLCGPEMIALVGDKRVTMPTAYCGHHSLDIAAPKLSLKFPSLKAFQNLWLPGNTKFPDMMLNLVWSAATHIQFLHEDGRVIFDGVYDSGFQRAPR